MKGIKISAIIGCLLFIGIAVNAQSIERVEPPNWWQNMHHQQIELMIYGEDVGELQPVINTKAVSLGEVTKVQNSNYLFFEITISDALKKETIEIDFYKGKRKMENINYPILKRDESIQASLGFDASDAIYLITPDRFANGDPSNDDLPSYKEKADRGDKNGRHGGDIQGMINHLDYIKDLGFTAIWLNPLLENNMDSISYHGYSTTDYYKVDERFGSNELYRKLADVGREKGVKLIMDMIVNHCGSDHWWMNDLPTNDWINQWQKYTGTSHRKTVMQDPYVSDSDKKQFTDGWFVPTMPDLNQRNKQMATYLIQNSLWWVEYLGLSGIRMDTYPYPDEDFMTDWTVAMMNEYPTLNIVGEEWYSQPAIVSYWQKGKTNANGYTSELKSLMDFPNNAKLIEALNNEETWSTGWIELYEMLAQDFLYADPMNLVVFPDNHDMPRYYTQLNEDINKYKQGITYTLTTRGIPQLYYGTEILMTSPKGRDDGLIRGDFPGGWQGDRKDAFKGQGLSTFQMEAKDWLSTILKWRQTADVIHKGKLKHFIPQDGIYTFFRYNEKDKVMVILSKNDEPVKLDLKRFNEILGRRMMGKDVATGKTYELLPKFTVPANAALILEIEPAYE